jgi:hypothetical protein
MRDLTDAQRRHKDAIFQSARARLAESPEPQDLNRLAAQVLDEYLRDPRDVRATSEEVRGFLEQGRIESDLGSSAIWEVDESGNRVPARAEIQAWSAPKDRWDQLATTSEIRWLMPDQKLALREELRQVLERELSFLERINGSAHNGGTQAGQMPATARSERALADSHGETQKERGARRWREIEPLWATATPPVTSCEDWAKRTDGLDKNAARDYINGKTKRPRLSTRVSLAKPLGVVDIPA